MMIAAINSHMMGTPTAPGEYVNWNKPDVMTEAEWYALLGFPVETMAEQSPHMIIFEVPDPGYLMYQNAPNLPAGHRIKCSLCGCTVTKDHEPGSESCEISRDERDRGRAL